MHDERWRPPSPSSRVSTRDLESSLLHRCRFRRLLLSLSFGAMHIAAGQLLDCQNPCVATLESTRAKRGACTIELESSAGSFFRLISDFYKTVKKIHLIPYCIPFPPSRFSMLRGLRLHTDVPLRRGTMTSARAACGMFNITLLPLRQRNPTVRAPP